MFGIMPPAHLTVAGATCAAGLRALAGTRTGRTFPALATFRALAAPLEWLSRGRSASGQYLQLSRGQVFPRLQVLDLQRQDLFELILVLIFTIVAQPTIHAVQ